LAIGLKRRNDYTVIMTGSLSADGAFCIVDVRRGRWDSFGIIAELLSVQKRYAPALFGIEKGQHIQMAIMPFLDAEMRRTNTYINKYDVPYAGDKPARAKAIQAMTRAGAVKFDKTASWWAGLENELSKFTEVGAKSGHDDQVDTLASLGIMVADAVRPMTQGEVVEEELGELEREYHRQGVSKITGY
jgi:predicted phage terminase large subunit-like protein